MRSLSKPELKGIHHTAFPTWKPKETVEFYRDIMGLPLIHAITAKGWGRDDHPDFLHFFFDTGNGSAIAFFYYIGTQPLKEPAGPRGYLGMSWHTAWRVETEEELQAWHDLLVKKGVDVSDAVDHEVIRSIYFRDPNGYPLEISLTTRELGEIDATDANLSIESLIETFTGDEHTAEKTIDDMWRRKAEKVRLLV